MNNALLAIEQYKSTLEIQDSADKAVLQEREAKLVRIISAVEKIVGSKEWSTLKTEILDGLTERLNKELTHEAKKEAPDTLKLRYLAGEIVWAERYADLQKFADAFKVELKSIKHRLHGKT